MGNARAHTASVADLVDDHDQGESHTGQMKDEHAGERLGVGCQLNSNFFYPQRQRPSFVHIALVRLIGDALHRPLKCRLLAGQCAHDGTVERRLQPRATRRQ